MRAHEPPFPGPKAVQAGRLATARSPLAALADVKITTRLLHDFLPLPDSLDWRLGQFAWQREGDSGFLRDEVPYVINNSGRLSDRTASLLLATLHDARPEGQIDLLEIGAGTGLFASLLLRRFAALCERDGADFHRRIRLHVTDGAERTVSAWQARGQFAAWDGAVVAARLDAIGEDYGPFRPFAVFANYVLDVLPARIVRPGAEGPEELHLRVHDTDEITPGPDCEGGTDDAALAERLHATALEAAFRPCRSDSPSLAVALAASVDGAAVILNEGAIAVLLRLVDRLAPGGFILVNDYGTPRPDSPDAPPLPQRFGDTVAMGLNFPLIETVLTGAGADVVAPEGDVERTIHSRLIGIGIPDRLRRLFSMLFSFDADRAAEAPAAEARAHAAAGRKDEALEALRRAVAAGPFDWQLLGWAGEYVGLGLGNAKPGAELVRAALELNPWTSPWLWNVLGDCLFMDGATAEAEAAYREALQIAPNDPRGNLNLGFTRALAQRHDEALAAIARGLAGDRTGEWHQRLLRKQSEVLEQHFAAENSRREAWSRRAMVVAAAVSTASTVSRPDQPSRSLPSVPSGLP